MDYYQKYLKYKNKYMKLKSLQSGGDCDPIPNPDNKELLTLKDYKNIPSGRLINIGDKCFDVESMVYIIIRKIKENQDDFDSKYAEPRNPYTGEILTPEEIWRIIYTYTEYRKSDDAQLNKPKIFFIYSDKRANTINEILKKIKELNKPLPQTIKDYIYEIKNSFKKI